MKSIAKEKFRFELTYIYVILCLLAGLFVIWAFTGIWPMSHNDYNSFSLQAKSWLEGRLDLGQNYEHLELAVFNGKYYVSFPPFISYVMLLFVPFFGVNTPDNLISLVIFMLSGIYSVKIYKIIRSNTKNAVFFSVFLLLGCNTLFCSVNGWVWFIAQNFAFTLSLMAIYYAIKGRLGLSLSLLACAVGCRPFQIVYTPLLFMLYITEWQKQNSKLLKNKHSFISRAGIFIKQKFTCFIFPAIIGLSYMILNYARFGNIFEFGHNYLPEFTSTATGQFNSVYIADNLKSLFKLPALAENSKLAFPTFNGMSIWMISPIFITFVVYFIYSLTKKNQDKTINILLPILLVIHTFLIVSHKTMGGWHFGNRYMNDLLPFVYLGIMKYMPDKESYVKWNYPLCCFGICLNIVGAVATYNNWI